MNDLFYFGYHNLNQTYLTHVWKLKIKDLELYNSVKTSQNHAYNM